MNTPVEPAVVDMFDYAVEVTAHIWIPMSDGIRLSAKVWRPVPSHEGETFPVVLEAIPYRKDDVSLWDDSVRMAYFAGNGYLCVRLDLRGSGDSEGVLDDEYSPREQADLVEAVAWLSTLEGCDGNVGMTGISWSGFNSLQTAQHRPPALKAIITVCSTDDRYDNDVHYMGGSLLGFYQNWWGSIMHEFNLRPADPYIVGESWYPMQMERMNHNPFLTSLWLAHQDRDQYWKPGSVCEDYDALVCPILAVGGWADGYTDAIFRLMENCPDRCWGIVGPWGHTWPERGIPGPAIGFLQECLYFWDHWLKGIDNGADTLPRLRYFLQDPCALTPDCAVRDGQWMQADIVGEKRSQTAYLLDAAGMLRAADEGGMSPLGGLVRHRSPLITGTQVDTWLPMGSPIDLPSEQTPDDQRSLCFDSAPLEEDALVMGGPVLHLCVSADRPQAMVFVRLCDVWPDGTSQLITRGNLNLTHRDSHEFPEALEVDRLYEVDISLKAVAERIPAGHRLRIALSTNYWPWIWPEPEQATITVDTQSSMFVLPVVDASDEPLNRPWQPAQIAVGESCEKLDRCTPYARRTYDPATRLLTYTRSTTDSVNQRTPSGFVFGGEKSTTYTIAEDDPLSATMQSMRTGLYAREGWEVRTEVDSTMSCTYDDFIVKTSTKVWIDGRQVHDEEHTETIGRRFN